MGTSADVAGIERRLDDIDALMVSYEKRVKRLEERVAVMEDCTAMWDGRLEDLEDWQTKIEDKVDQEL